MNNPLRLFRGHRPDGDAISAWLDGALQPAAASALEAHIADCEACRARADELRGVRASLAALPDVDAPRSFRVHPAQLEAPRPAPRAPSPWMRYAPAVSAAAMVVFAVLVGVDVTRTADDDAAGVGGFGLSADSSEMAAAPRAESDAADTASPPAAGAAADAAAPDVATTTDGDDRAFSSATPSAPTPEEQIGAITRDGTEETAEAIQIREPADDDDGVAWLRIAQVAAVAVAVVAAVVAAGTWFSRRLTA